jgi:hypothetical protein
MTTARAAQKNWFESAVEEAAKQAAERVTTSEAQRAVRVVVEQRLRAIPPDLDAAITALDLEHARRVLSAVAAANTAADIRTALGA